MSPICTILFRAAKRQSINLYIWNENYIKEEYIFVTLGDFIALHCMLANSMLDCGYECYFIEKDLTNLFWVKCYTKHNTCSHSVWLPANCRVYFAGFHVF